jgi:hypothetical protein
MKRLLFCLALATLASPHLLHGASRAEWKFSFGGGVAPNGSVRVDKDAAYSPERGFGFLDGATAAQTPFTFAVDVPEGNYDVTLRFGDKKAAASATVKAEARRLMIEKVTTPAGKFDSRTFTVNRRTPEITTGRRVSLNKRELGPPVGANWDDHLTLEFLGSPGALDSLEIKPSPQAVTVFIAGDSTVNDQSNEPWAGWGQILPWQTTPSQAARSTASGGRSGSKKSSA